MANPIVPVGANGAPEPHVALPFSQELNVSQPLVWYGDGRDSRTPAQLISDIDQKRVRCGWTERATMHYIGVCFQGPSLDWFRTAPMTCTNEEDRQCFSGEGPTPWSHFQKLFTRAFLVGGKTHRVDQRQVFRQHPKESILAYKARCLEVYKMFREERGNSLREATAVTNNIDDNRILYSLNTALLNGVHIGHAAPGDGQEEGNAEKEHDRVQKEGIYNSQIAGIRRLVTEELAALQRHMIARTENYLALEFSNYLLIDGIHHIDVRKYAMDLVEKKTEDCLLLWDLIHKFSDIHHPLKDSTAPHQKDGYVPGAGVAGAIGTMSREEVDGLDGGKKKLKDPNAFCNFCKKKGHKEGKCFKKNRLKKAGKLPKGTLAPLDVQQQQQQQQQAIQAVQQLAQQQQQQQPSTTAAASAAAQVAAHQVLAQQALQLQQQAMQQQQQQGQFTGGFSGQAGAMQVDEQPMLEEAPLNSQPWC